MRKIPTLIPEDANEPAFTNNLDPLNGLNRLFKDPTQSDRGYKKVDYRLEELSKINGNQIKKLGSNLGPEEREVDEVNLRGFNFKKNKKDEYVEVVKREKSGMWGYKKKTYRIKKPDRLEDLIDFKAENTRDKYC